MSDPETPQTTDESPAEPLPVTIGGVIVNTEQMRASLEAGPEN